jgi:hypothetical protein
MHRDGCITLLVMIYGTEARILASIPLITAGERTHGYDPKVGCEEVHGKESTG